MIFSTLDVDYTQFHYPKAIERALAFLKEQDFSNVEAGSYEILGRKMYANVDVVTTKAFEDTKIEGHKEYIDVQYMVQGLERMEYVRYKEDFNIVESYDDKDCYFYNPMIPMDGTFTVGEGQYAIFYPGDLHRTLIAIEGQELIKKVVVKVHVSLLDVDSQEMV